MAWFPLSSWRIFSLDVGFSVDSSFFKHFSVAKYFATSLWHLWILMGNPLAFDCFSLIGSACFLSDCFQDFFLVFSFLKFYDVTWYGYFLNYSIWHLLRIWICKLMSFAKFGKFLAIISNSTFFIHVVSPLLWGLQWHDCLIFQYNPVDWGSIYWSFFPTVCFFSFIKLSNLIKHCSIFQLIDSFFQPPCSAFQPIQWVFSFSYCSF